MMKSFIYKEKEIEFFSVTGEVIGSDKHSETHVSSSGGGGYVSKHGGHVSAPKVSSTSITNHEFWIKTEDGIEKDVRLKGVDIPLRKDQKITIISARNKGSNDDCFSILVNHSANKHWYINRATDLNRLLNIEIITGKSILIGGAIWFGLSYITESIGLGAAVAGVFVLYRIAIKISKSLKLRKSLALHLEALAESAY